MKERSGQDDEFGARLRAWREARGISQEELSYRASLSTRHISFLENGRSEPSRESVLALGDALEVPLRERNRLLRSAGFAAVYPDRGSRSAARKQVRSVLGFVQRRHEPYPCFVVDRLWTVETCNTAGGVLLERLLGRRAPDETEGTNLLRLLFRPDRLRPHVVNLGQLHRLFVERLERILARRPADPATRALLADLESYGTAPSRASESAGDAGQAVVPVHLRHDGGELRLLSTVMTVGEPRDVVLEELRLETFFPLDEATDSALLRWYGERRGEDRDPVGVAGEGA